MPYKETPGFVSELVALLFNVCEFLALKSPLRCWESRLVSFSGFTESHQSDTGVRSQVGLLLLPSTSLSLL